MLKFILTKISILVLYSSLFSQSSQETIIMQPVHDLFQAMQSNDSMLAASVFTPDAVLYTIYQDKEGNYQRKVGSAANLVSAFAKPKDQVWTEPIWNEKIETDGGLASVWVNYAFYIDNTFSHCGVDAFQLQKTEQGWKIFYLADTRRKDNCEVPDNVRELYKR